MKNNKEVSIIFRVSIEERERYKKLSEDAGLPLSEIIRKQLDYLIFKKEAAKK